MAETSANGISNFSSNHSLADVYRSLSDLERRAEGIVYNAQSMFFQVKVSIHNHFAPLMDENRRLRERVKNLELEVARLREASSNRDQADDPLINVDTVVDGAARSSTLATNVLTLNDGRSGYNSGTLYHIFFPMSPWPFSVRF